MDRPTPVSMRTLAKDSGNLQTPKTNIFTAKSRRMFQLWHHQKWTQDPQNSGGVPFLNVLEGSMGNTGCSGVNVRSGPSDSMLKIDCLPKCIQNVPAFNLKSHPSNCFWFLESFSHECYCTWDLWSCSLNITSFRQSSRVSFSKSNSSSKRCRKSKTKKWIFDLIEPIQPTFSAW